jgi:two-component system, chemotaxis family, CheB/CheR fusion protein
VTDENTPDGSSEKDADDSPHDAAGLAALLDYLHRARGFDFTGYKTSSLARRIRRRMQLVSIDTFAAYTDYLEVHPDEFPQLFDMVLINVTAFFRDAAAWEALAARIPKLLAARPAESAIRAWSAGCASGEEAFTIAMVLAEHMGIDAVARRVKIYATDLDDDALTQARHATYGAKGVEGVPPELLERYFTRNGSSFVFNKELRRAVIFGRHDLVQDAPISRVDILTCRNTLMYFNAETQTRILNRLHFALNDDGIIFLGKAEMLLTHGNLFTPVDLKLRLFTRAARSTRMRERWPLDTRPQGRGNGDADGEPVEHAAEKNERARLEHAAFDASPNAVVVLDAQGRLAMSNAHAAHLFGLHTRDIGRPFQDLEVSYRPVEIRSYVDLALADKRAKHIRDVERVTGGHVAYYDVTVTPLLRESLDAMGVQIAFVDVTHHRRLQTELRTANTELEAAHEELQSTSEELETTNEELQSTVEELETTNEELQSTNEELETMNEELQSTNEELQTMNEELRLRGLELNRVNTFFSTILRTLHSGVTVLDAELRVQAWNATMEDLWGLRADEVDGKHFLNLEIGLPVADLAAAVRSCLQGEGEVEKTVACTNRRGKAVTCRVFITPLSSSETRGVIVLVEEKS